MGSTTHSYRQGYFHEIFSCPFGHFVVQKEFLAYLTDVLRLREDEAVGQLGVALAPFHLVFALFEGLADAVTGACSALFGEGEAVICGIKQG
jgi:hypothetical protein